MLRRCGLCAEVEQEDSRPSHRPDVRAQGFTLGFQLPNVLRDLNRSSDEIRRRILSKEFDLVVFARISPSDRGKSAWVEAREPVGGLSISVLAHTPQRVPSSS